jgi:hypothetical protein
MSDAIIRSAQLKYARPTSLLFLAFITAASTLVAMPVVVYAADGKLVKLAQRDNDREWQRERNDRANEQRRHQVEQERIRRERDYNFRHNGYYRRPVYPYAPPPVYYAPPPRPPVIDFVFPFYIR